MMREEFQIVLYLAVIIAGIGISSVINTIRLKRRTDKIALESYGKIPLKGDPDLSAIREFHSHRRETADPTDFVDEITWNDLNMDDVFRRINRCCSSTGEEYLYHVLHDLEPGRASVRVRDELANWLDESPNDRVRLQKILLAVGKEKHNGLSFYLHYPSTKSLKHSGLYAMMAILPILGALIAFFKPTVGFILVVLSVIANVFVYSRLRIRLEAELESLRYFSAFLYGAKAIEKEFGEKLRSVGFDLKTN